VNFIPFCYHIGTMNLSIVVSVLFVGFLARSKASTDQWLEALA
jgi:hypothetical protein